MSISVHLGNTAVTASVAEPATKEQAEAAGPLGRQEISETGQTEYKVLRQKPHPVGQSVTTFHDLGAVEANYDLTDFVRDIMLAYRSQHSSEPPAWIVSSDPAVAYILQRNFTVDGVAPPILKDVPRDAGPGSVGSGFHKRREAEGE